MPIDFEDDGNSQRCSAEMNSGNPKLSAEEVSAKRRLLAEIVAHFPSEEVVNYYCQWPSKWTSQSTS